MLQPHLRPEAMVLKLLGTLAHNNSALPIRPSTAWAEPRHACRHCEDWRDRKPQRVQVCFRAKLWLKHDGHSQSLFFQQWDRHI